ncbi:Phenol UDP-glucosyltransferase [Operophtera brumata]|uniref:Phenol UDP-glucosyltransferase n=1 Tax=Operophtera brumata TaxID=104452 RepID=A0A0L7L1H6_OPEBR|nr:Phenol UDP-glucosyltransferase [Operophtera brumata]
MKQVVSVTGGAPHLRSPALLVPWYQKFYVDLLVLLIAAWFILKIVLKRVWRTVSGTKVDVKKKSD